MLCSVILLINFTGCQKKNCDILLTAVSQLDTAQHTEQLHEYDSPYTICYKNKDNTYSLYIFASPIQYKINDGKYAIIDNTVVKSEKEGFAYANKANEIKTYFPETLDKYFRVEKGDIFQEFKPSIECKGFSKAECIIFTNMYGDKVSAVRYRREDMDMVFYPTKSGIKVEIVLKKEPADKKFGFSLKTKASLFKNLQNGYILFKNGGENESIIYQPLVQYTTDSGQQLDITTQMNIEKKEGDYYVEMIINDAIFKNAKYPVKFDPSFELYLNKMPDTSVYSKFGINSYLKHYAVIGDHPTLGEGYHFARLRLNYFMTLQSENIKSAIYFIKPLWNNLNSYAYKAYESAEQWSSTKILWESKSQSGDVIAQRAMISEGNLQLPMDEYVKACFEDYSWEKESVGFLIKIEKENAYSILATSDNSLYPPFLKIDLKALPCYFEAKEDINQG